MSDETLVKHNWLWVIIPFGKNFEPLLSGYCKPCDTAFTKILQANSHGQLITQKAGVPEWGCVVPKYLAQN